MPTDDEWAAAQRQSAPTSYPAAPPRASKVNKHIFYPKDGQYEFDPSRLSFSARPQKSSDGFGTIAYVQYKHEDGVCTPVTVQMPTVFTPTGIRFWPDKQVNCIISLGKDADKNPQMMGFMAFAQMFLAALVVAIKQINWAGETATEDDIAEMVQPLVQADVNKKTGERYPPSVRANVSIAGRDRTSTFLYGTNQKVCESDVVAQSTITPIISIRWVYCKIIKTPRGSTPYFQPNVLLFQCVLHPSERPFGDECYVFSGHQLAIADAPADGAQQTGDQDGAQQDGAAIVVATTPPADGDQCDVKTEAQSDDRHDGGPEAQIPRARVIAKPGPM